ncbi:hypothetical protein M3P19_09675 [Muricauda sp. 2012CJ35-5]|uniref:Methionyl-tRNA formyltransferase n=1 Tax=Flagellimonas spongiicola TaxID=2942208 RepID=A0ABT0PSE8_9FLAO|nr:formyltransferase family protein [Allomuricauda spongiicola]MCL6274279.1 hypothetical protein [Allomuricauda spongiicola]
MSSINQVAIFGCKSTTKFLLSYLIGLNYKVTLITIDPDKGKSQKVADYCNLSGYCKENEIDFFVSQKYSLKSDDDLAYFEDKKFSIGFVVGWQRLVPSDVLDTFSIGVFGMHGSPMNLPKGRGRSPMNWSIIEGRKVFYTNLFKYDAGADDGDILDTFKFQISESDTGETMHFKNTLAMKYLIAKNIAALANGAIELTKQPNLTPTYYPKRTEEDSLIDWDDDIYNIERLIRAVTKPFNGAYSFINNCKVVIYRASIFDFQDFGYEYEVAGKVVEKFDNGKFLVNAFGGLLLVHDYLSEKAVMVGDVFRSVGLTSKFERNKFGFHDV